MSDLLERISLAFPAEHVLCVDDSMLRRPPSEATRDDLVKLADPMSALANTTTGGIMLVGITNRRGWPSGGVARLHGWRRTIRDIASALSPRPSIEIQPGHESGSDVLAVRVRPTGPSRRVVRSGARPLTVRGGDAVHWYEDTLCPVTTPFGTSMRSALKATSPLDIDPKAADAIGLPHPVWWSVAHRHRAAAWGLVADDGFTLTRMGALLLATAGRTRRVTVHLRGRAVTRGRIDGPLLLLRDALDDVLAPVAGDAVAAAAGIVLQVACLSAHEPAARVYVEARTGGFTVHTTSMLRRSVDLERTLGRFSGWSPEQMQRAARQVGLQVRSVKPAGGLRLEVDFGGATVTKVARPGATKAAAPSSTAASRRSTSGAPRPKPKTERAAALMACLPSGASRSRRELQGELGWSRSKLRNALEAAIGRGDVVREASSPRSPHQSYRRA